MIDFQSDVTLDEVYKAYHDCKRGKSNTYCAKEFAENLEYNIALLHCDLVTMQYKPGRSICFVVEHPKVREVWAADFRDRIVHHLLYNRYSHTFHKSFIHDSYACLPNKGTLAGAKRLQHFVRASIQDNPEAKYLKADIANFFMSIDKDIMFDILLKKIRHPWWQWLTGVILYHDPSTDVHIKSSRTLLNKVPKQKSLLHNSNQKGLPIGNLSSQFFANIYMNEFDQYVKHVLKVKYYVRYVDDIVILDKNIDLNVTYQKMSMFLNTYLKLSFHPKKLTINKVSHGIDFVGYIVKQYTFYIRKRTVNSLFRAPFRSPNPIASINSYLGFLIHGNTYNIRRIFVSLHPQYIFSKDYNKVITS